MDKTLVLIEDNPVFLGLLTAFLEQGQEEALRVVGAARTGEEGVELVDRLAPQGAVVDLRLPAMTGFEVIARVRARHPDLAVVAITQAEPEEFRTAALAAGADEFVPKEHVHTDLLPAIRHSMAAHGREHL